MDKQCINIILANAPINNGNKGCVALSISALMIIDKILKKANINYNIWLPDSQFNDGKVHKINIGGETIFFKDCFYPPVGSFYSRIKTIIKGIIKRRNYIELFKKADYILDIGQGDSFSDIYGKDRYILIDKIHEIAQSYKIPYCILPQTIGPFRDANILKSAVRSIENASLCMVRDKQSLDFIKSNTNIQCKCDEYIDVAFFLPFSKISQNPDFIHVGLNVSALLWNGGYTHKNELGLKVDYQKLIESIISYFLTQENVLLHLIPHVVPNDFPIENDYLICNEIKQRYKNNSKLLVCDIVSGPVEIKSYIAGMDFFMGARMHATIGAFSSGVPVVPMAYSRKFNGMFENTLNYCHMADLKSQTNEEVLSLIIQSYASRNSIKKEIEIINNTVVKELENLFLKDLTSFFN